MNPSSHSDKSKKGGTKLQALLKDQEAWLNADWDEAWEKLEKDLFVNDLVSK